MGTGSLSTGIKRPRHEADHSFPFSAEGNNGELKPPLDIGIGTGSSLIEGALQTNKQTNKLRVL
jgi:hypothetical protein